MAVLRQVLRQALERWSESGRNRQVTWKYVRRSLMLATFSIGVTLAAGVAWVAQIQRDNYNDKVAFCHVREDATTELSTFARSVRDFAVGIQEIVADSDPSNPNVARLAVLAANLAVAADAYQPVTFDECMAASANP